MIHQGTINAYPEVEGLSVLLGYKTQNAGCCKVPHQQHARHPTCTYSAGDPATSQTCCSVTFYSFYASGQRLPVHGVEEEQTGSKDLS